MWGAEEVRDKQQAAKKGKRSKHKERKTEKERKRKRQGPQRPLPTYNWRDHCLLTTPGTTEKRKEQAEQASKQR